VLIEQTQFSHHPLFGKIALGFGAAEARAINVSDGGRLFAFGALRRLFKLITSPMTDSAVSNAGNAQLQHRKFIPPKAAIIGDVP
jgi:hypothetical protein